jgi:hypothetical protein
VVTCEHIGPHEYSFSEGILCFAPRGVVLPEHAAQLVALLEQHGRPSQALPCLFDLTGAARPTPEARRVVVDFLRSRNPQISIATYGAPLYLRAMMALVSSAARVLGGYQLQIRHFEGREESLQYLRQSM